jgi:hypothetical protein
MADDEYDLDESEKAPVAGYFGPRKKSPDERWLDDEYDLDESEKAPVSVYFKPRKKSPDDRWLTAYETSKGFLGVVSLFAVALVTTIWPKSR